MTKTVFNIYSQKLIHLLGNKEYYIKPKLKPMHFRAADINKFTKNGRIVRTSFNNLW